MIHETGFPLIPWRYFLLTFVFLCFGPHCEYSQRTGAGTAGDGVSLNAAAEPQQAEGGPTLGFVGAGMMATAMINGIIASKVCVVHVVPGSRLYCRWSRMAALYCTAVS